MIRSVIVCLTSLALLAAPAQGQSDAITEYVRAQLDWRLIPGVSFAVMKAGRIVRAEAHGVASRESNDKASVTTAFQMGSVGKQFTAAAILLLHQEGRLQLDSAIPQYLPGTPSAWQGMTIRHLLTHTSGLGDYDNAIQNNLDREYSRDALMSLIASQAPTFRPGAGFQYSNSGYVLLGLIVEAVSGEHLGDFLAKRIFGPLQMTASGMVGRTGMPSGAASGYRLADGVVSRAPSVSRSLNSTGDGSLYSTVLDMAKWDAALYRDDLLNAASRRAMWTAVRLNDRTTRAYGFGWGLGSFRNHRIVEHGGSWQGFAAHVVRYPDDRISVVVLTNLTGVGNTAGLIANRVARYYVPGLRAEAWPTHPTVVVDATTLDEYAGDFRLGTEEIRIRRQRGELIISAKGRGTARMIPTSRTTFRLEVDQLQLRFRPRSNGRPDLIVIDGKERLATRVSAGT